MLDWFSRLRLVDEQEVELCPLQPGHILRDYVFKRPNGEILFLSELRTKAVLALLPCAPGPTEAYFLERLTTEFTGVRRQPTRVLVVTRPEYLSTVVAFGGALLIVTDETGEAMVELGAAESPIAYLIGPKRERIGVLEGLGVGSPLPEIKLRLAA